MLSAAFIGPGTITAAGSAGSGFGFTLLWALLFSTVACVMLQEAGARLTISGEQNLGESIAARFRGTPAGTFAIWLVGGSIVLGCAAYEAGNILGGVAGLGLVLDVSPALLTAGIGLAAFLLLWFGSTDLIAKMLGGVVALMGICFLTTALIMQPPLGELLGGLFVPAVPTGSELLVIGLIGTTVVPYNLFLGSNIRHSQSLREMRFSLSFAVILGGVISMAVLVVGSSVAGSFSYEGLAGALAGTLGGWAAVFFALGLAAAGLSSALTAPLAAALTAQSLWGTSAAPEASPGGPASTESLWREGGSRFRAVWIGVLLCGVGFGVSQVQPIPAIILAQALNGIILPLIAIFLLLMANDRGLLGTEHINGGWANALTGIIVFVTLVIGLTNVARALNRVLDVSLVRESWILALSALLAALLLVPIYRRIMRYRSGG
ncbi:MAG: divalent metal cation transporter [Balneolaceae bacterium]|nr:divalent metal cation transporter [Balneolaceae bacterium]